MKTHCLMMIVFAVALTVTSCGGGSAVTEPESQSAESWVGSHIDSLVRSWGMPTSLWALSNGGTIYEYYDEEVSMDGDDVEVEWCVTQLETDREGVITYVTTQGDACP